MYCCRLLPNFRLASITRNWNIPVALDLQSELNKDQVSRPFILSAAAIHLTTTTMPELHTEDSMAVEDAGQKTVTSSFIQGLTNMDLNASDAESLSANIVTSFSDATIVPNSKDTPEDCSGSADTTNILVVEGMTEVIDCDILSGENATTSDDKGMQDLDTFSVQAHTDSMGVISSTVPFYGRYSPTQRTMILVVMMLAVYTSLAANSIYLPSLQTIRRMCIHARVSATSAH